MYVNVFKNSEGKQETAEDMFDTEDQARENAMEIEQYGEWEYVETWKRPDEPIRLDLSLYAGVDSDFDEIVADETTMLIAKSGVNFGE